MAHMFLEWLSVCPEMSGLMILVIGTDPYTWLPSLAPSRSDHHIRPDPKSTNIAANPKSTMTIAWTLVYFDNRGLKQAGVL